MTQQLLLKLDTHFVGRTLFIVVIRVSGIFGTLVLAYFVQNLVFDKCPQDFLCSGFFQSKNLLCLNIGNRAVLGNKIYYNFDYIGVYRRFIGVYQRFIGADICIAFLCFAVKHHHKAGLQLIKTVFYTGGGTGVMNPLQARAEAFDVLGIVQSSCDNGVSPDRPFGMLNKILWSVSLRELSRIVYFDSTLHKVYFLEYVFKACVIKLQFVFLIDILKDSLLLGSINYLKAFCKKSFSGSSRSSLAQKP